MKKYLKELKISLTIILGGMLIPTLLSIIFSGFRVSVVSIVNFEFFTGLFISSAGGIVIVSDFFRFRKKVLKSPAGSEIEEDESISSDGNKVNWGYMLFYTGLVILLLAVGVGEIF